MSKLFFSPISYISILKPIVPFHNIKNYVFDLYYEILLTCNRNTQLCRRIISLRRFYGVKQE